MIRRARGKKIVGEIELAVGHEGGGRMNKSGRSKGKAGFGVWGRSDLQREAEEKRRDCMRKSRGLGRMVKLLQRKKKKKNRREKEEKERSCVCEREGKRLREGFAFWVVRTAKSTNQVNVISSLLFFFFFFLNFQISIKNGIYFILLYNLSISFFFIFIFLIIKLSINN